MFPKAKSRTDLIIKQIEEELVVYDLERDQGHTLNPTAALVFQMCDGRTTPDEMAAQMSHTLDVPYADKLTWMALDRLDQAHLLTHKLERPVSVQLGLTRRQMLKLAGKAGVVMALLPMVASIVVPTPAQASSGGHPGGDGNPGNGGDRCKESYYGCLDACKKLEEDAEAEERICHQLQQEIEALENGAGGPNSGEEDDDARLKRLKELKIQYQKHVMRRKQLKLKAEQCRRQCRERLNACIHGED